MLPSNFVRARSRSGKIEQTAKGERHSSATSYFDRGKSNSAVGNLPALGVARDNNGGGVFQNIWDGNTERASPLEVPSARFNSTAPLHNGELFSRPSLSLDLPLSLSSVWLYRPLAKQLRKICSSSVFFCFQFSAQIAAEVFII